MTTLFPYLRGVTIKKRVAALYQTIEGVFSDAQKAELVQNLTEAMIAVAGIEQFGDDASYRSHLTVPPLRLGIQHLSAVIAGFVRP